MRSDPYQERARAPAIEAGLDPDTRIDRPGQRPLPLWCTFRDAARKEHLAREAQAVAADIAIKPQAAQYRDSPLKIFGRHDDATIAQMRNCMSVGNAVAGVICADGHLGYAQPVGGVIAYEKEISISGVGFDIGCGNMAVRLDTPFSQIESNVARSSRTCTRRSPSASGAAMKSGSSTRCSTTAMPGASRTWQRIGRRRSRNSAPSDRATTMST
jgi:tRNA-splicing ligase RtcB